MSNQEICLHIYQNINIKGICYTIGIRRDIDDIEQRVYDIILHYPNKKINNIYDNGALLSFIWKTIFNQISKNKKSEWYMLQEYKRLDDNYNIIDEEYNVEREEKLKFLDEEFKSYDNNEILYMNFNQQQYYIRKNLLKNKIKKGWTLDEMRDKFKISRNSINDTIQFTKKELKEKYENRNKT